MPAELSSIELCKRTGRVRANAGPESLITDVDDCQSYLQSSKASGMAIGKVKGFNDQKGFGFIASVDNREIFVHHTVIEGEGHKELKDGETVEYQANSTAKGLVATKVRRLVPASTRIAGTSQAR